MISVLEFFSNAITRILGIFESVELFEYNVAGVIVTINFLDIVLGFVVLSMVIGLFWKGARG